MTDSAENKPVSLGPDLKKAIREVKNDLADRSDVVVDLRELQRTRLELLAEELAPVFSQVSRDDDRFDFAISSGAQPRLWIDAVAHVVMGRDRRTYRFLRDTRLGRVVLAETLDIKAVAERVTRYVAERVVERERMLEGETAPVSSTEAAAAAEPAARPSRMDAFLKGVGVLALGLLAGAAIAAIFAWDRIAPLVGITSP